MQDETDAIDPGFLSQRKAILIRISMIENKEGVVNQELNKRCYDRESLRRDGNYKPDDTAAIDAKKTIR